MTRTFEITLVDYRWQAIFLEDEIGRGIAYSMSQYDLLREIGQDWVEAGWQKVEEKWPNRVEWWFIPATPALKRSPAERFRVQVLEYQAPWGWCRHLKVQRVDGKDGITWDELQALKDEYLGAGVAAVEFYPPASDTVNELNMRHLWECPQDWLPMHRQ